MLNTGKVETGVELKLMVVRFHVCAEFIKGFVVLFLFEVSEFMDNDHTQKGFRDFFEQRSNTDLILAFEFGALYTGGEGVHTECIVDNMDLAVKKDFAERLTLFEIAVLDLKSVVVEVFVCFTVMGIWIFLQKKRGESLLCYQGDDLCLDRLIVMF